MINIRSIFNNKKRFLFAFFSSMNLFGRIKNDKRGHKVLLNKNKVTPVVFAVKATLNIVFCVFFIFLSFDYFHVHKNIFSKISHENIEITYSRTFLLFIFLVIFIGGMKKIFFFSAINVKNRFLQSKIEALQNKIKKDKIQRDALLEENDVLLKDAKNKEDSDKILASLKYYYETKNAIERKNCLSFVELLAHAVKNESCSSQVIRLVAELRATLAQPFTLCGKGSPTEVDIEDILTRVHIALTPFLTRSCLSWRCETNGKKPLLTLDPPLLELCLLALCKEVAMYSYEGATLVFYVSEIDLQLHVEGDCVVRKLFSKSEIIDLGFAPIDKGNVFACLEALDLEVEMKTNGFHMSFGSASKNAKKNTNNIIPLFAS